GNITLTPDDPVARLEEQMVDSNWGQIPVIDHHQNLIGIVTRTDLIKHWRQKHPGIPPTIPQVNPQIAKSVLGEATFTLITSIAQQAQQQAIPLYLVGGVVR